MAPRQPRPSTWAGTHPLIAFRYSSYDTPFWVRPNSAAGRWATPEDGPTQYLCLHPRGAWAELARREALRTEEELALVRTRVWVARVESAGLANYSTFALAKTAGFPPEALVDEDHTRCRAEGARLRDVGYVGVLAPSAATADVVNLTLFGPRRRIGWNDEPRLASALPATTVALGAPPPGLSQHVRHYRDSHAGLVEFRRRAGRRQRRS